MALVDGLYRRYHEPGMNAAVQAVVGTMIAATVPICVAFQPTPKAEHIQSKWGQSVDGVRMSVALVDENTGNPQLQITIQNASERPKALAVGFLSGGLPHFPITVTVTTPKGRSVFNGDSPLPVNAPIDPLVAPLVPNASYTIQTPVASYRSPEESLGSVMLHPSQLSVEFEGDKSICDAYGYPHPNPIPCWYGKLVSNTLLLPKR